MRIDHVTIAWNRLERLESRFRELGFPVRYGGPHSNGKTHMSIIACRDGSYLELISTLELGLESPWWPVSIASNGGPCGWAIRANRLEPEIERFSKRGFPIRGPEFFSRRRTDGTEVRFSLAFPGDHDPGAVLPFLVTDETPRELRVQAGPSLETPSWLEGVAMVILGVADFEGGIDLFRRAFDLPPPRIGDEPELAAQLARFPDTPVTLASPVGNEGWLAQRLRKFGDSPCGYLLRAADQRQCQETFELTPWSRWSKDQVAWIQPQQLLEMRIGFMA